MSSRDASDTIRRNKQRTLFADKTVQETALKTGTTNHLVLEGGTNRGLISYTPYFTNIANGETQTTPEELAAYKASATPSVPSAPYGATATPGDTEARVTFTAPSNTGSSPITSYTVTSDPDGMTATGSQTPITVTGLTNGTAYTFTVTAQNDVGSSEPSSASNSVTPSGAPLAPTINSVTNLATSLEINLTAGGTNGAPISNYEYSLDNGSSWVKVIPWQTTSPITVTNTNNSTTYNVRIRAANTKGPGAQSNIVTVGPVPVPTAPTNLVGTSGNEQVSITFTAASGNGLPLTNYEYSLNDGVSWSPASTASPIVITGLTNGAAYKIKLRAVSAAGSGTASDTLYITPLPFSGLQLLLDAATYPGDISGSAVTWNDYSGKGKHATAYNFFNWSSANGGRLQFNGTNNYVQAPSGFADFTSGLTILAIADFGSGGDYERILDFADGPSANNIILAREGVGNNLWFEIYNGASTALVAKQIGGITNNAWGFYGGRVDGSNYKVFTINNSTSGASSVLPQNVTRDLNYIGKSNWPNALFQRYMGVIAIFNTALSDAEITAFLDLYRSRFVPAAPTGLSAEAGDTQATISFIAGSDNGAPITNYEYSTDGINYTALSPADSTSPITITGLTNNVEYTITLKAVNAFGTSVASSSVTVTPTNPSQVLTSFTTVGSTTWTAPAGVTSVEYLVVGGGGGGGGAYDGGAGGGGAGGCFKQGIAAVTPGQSYTIEVGNGGSGGVGMTGVTAGDGLATAGGQSVFDTIVVPGGGAGGGSLVDRTGAGGSVGVESTLTAPMGGKGGRTPQNSYGGGGGGGMLTGGVSASSGTGNAGGSGITSNFTGVNVTYAAGGNGGRISVNANGAAGAANRGNGGNGASAVFVDGSTGGAGGSGIVILKYTISQAVPEAPTGLTATGGNAQATISFTPGSDGGFPITNYEYSTDGTNFTALSPADTTSPVTVTGLTNGTMYTLYLRAVNENGPGASSTGVSVTPSVPTGDSNVLILGDASVTSVLSYINTAKTSLGYGGTITMTTQQLNGYTGTDLANYQLVLIYTNGGLSLNATLGANLNAFVASGKHLIMMSFCWGNVSAISSFNYADNSVWAYNGSYTSISTNALTYSTTHPITSGLTAETGIGSQSVPSPITLTSGAATIATYSNGTSAIAVKTVGGANLIGFNSYPFNVTSGNFHKYVVNAIYWSMGYLS